MSDDQKKQTRRKADRKERSVFCRTCGLRRNDRRCDITKQCNYCENQVCHGRLHCLRKHADKNIEYMMRIIQEEEHKVAQHDFVERMAMMERERVAYRLAVYSSRPYVPDPFNVPGAAERVNAIAKRLQVEAWVSGLHQYEINNEQTMEHAADDMQMAYQTPVDVESLDFDEPMCETPKENLAYSLTQEEIAAFESMM